MPFPSSHSGRHGNKSVCEPVNELRRSFLYKFPRRVSYHNHIIFTSSHYTSPLKQQRHSAPEHPQFSEVQHVVWRVAWPDAETNRNGQLRPCQEVPGAPALPFFVVGQYLLYELVSSIYPIIYKQSNPCHMDDGDNH